MTENTNTRHAAARAFVRSLNILLKFARMYDFGHPRTDKQFETAWSELRTAFGSDNEAGLLLAVSGEQLLLDGTPIESADQIPPRPPSGPPTLEGGTPPRRPVRCPGTRIAVR